MYSRRREHLVSKDPLLDSNLASSEFLDRKTVLTSASSSSVDELEKVVENESVGEERTKCSEIKNIAASHLQPLARFR